MKFWWWGKQKEKKLETSIACRVVWILSSVRGTVNFTTLKAYKLMYQVNYKETIQIFINEIVEAY